MTDNLKSKQKPKQKVAKQLSKNAIAELDKLAKEAEFLDREDAEARIHDRPKLGISSDEPELELGRRIQEAREAARLTQGELAELTKQADPEGNGISRSVISFYEIGKSRPSPRELRMLSEVLKVSPSYLIYGVDDPFDNLSQWGRFRGFARSNPELQSLFLHAFNSLHHHHKFAVMELMMGLLRGWNEKWWEDMGPTANEHLLETAAALKEILASRKEEPNT